MLESSQIGLRPASTRPQTPNRRRHLVMLGHPTAVPRHSTTPFQHPASTNRFGAITCLRPCSAPTAGPSPRGLHTDLPWRPDSPPFLQGPGAQRRCRQGWRPNLTMGPALDTCRPMMMTNARLALETMNQDVPTVVKQMPQLEDQVETWLAEQEPGTLEATLAGRQISFGGVEFLRESPEWLDHHSHWAPVQAGPYGPEFPKRRPNSARSTDICLT